MCGSEPAGTIILTRKSLPAISSTKYLKGAILTVMILSLLTLGLVLQEKRAAKASRMIFLFICKYFRSACKFNI
jgi:hypothetical protein